jgi:hypothetical protein
LEPEEGTMPITYVIDIPRRMIFITATGDIDLVTYREYLEAREADPLYERTMSAIFDAREAHFVFSREDMRWCVDFTKNTLPKTRTKRAIVVSGSHEYGLSRMFQTLSLDSKLEYSIFRDYDAAMDWVESRNS